MTTLFWAQFALPLVLMAWIGFAPPRTRHGFGIQLIGSAAALWAMALLGIWLLPPWWAPYAFGLALAAAVGAGLRRIWPFASALSMTWRGRIVAGLFVVLGAASAYGIVIALRSRMASISSSSARSGFEPAVCCLPTRVPIASTALAC